MIRPVRAVAVAVLGLFAVAACSTSQDTSCPADLPVSGTACNIANQTSELGSVPECGYATGTNECGADNCYCEHGSWLCSPTCAIADSGFLLDATVPDSAAGETSSGSQDGSSDAYGSDASVVEASGTDAAGVEPAGDP
jgi:hypothetical protein